MAIYDVPTSAFDIRFQKSLNGSGSATFKISEYDFNIEISQAVAGDRFNVNLFGSTVFQFIWEETNKTYDGDQLVITISGRGSIAALRKAIAYPDSSKSKLISSVDPYIFNYGTTYNIPSESGVKGVYIRSEVDPRTDYGSTVGNVVSKLLEEANARNAAIITVNGASSTDASGIRWVDFSADSFKVRVGTDILSVIENLAELGFCIFRQEGEELSLYSAKNQMTTIDFTDQQYRVKGFTYSENYRDKTNHSLIVDGEVITSYRPNAETISTEKGISLELSNDPNVHASIGEEAANDFKIDMSINTVVEENNLKNPLFAFDVGDFLTYYGQTKRLLNVTVNIDGVYPTCRLELGDYTVPEKPIEAGTNERVDRVEKRSGAGGGGGFARVEVRTDDPASPVLGQMWLRSDL